MKKFVITSDKYSFCLQGFQKLINKYWNFEDPNFTILGFNNPNCEIGKNFSFCKLGENLTDKTNWDEALNPFFNNLNEDYFFLCFEDHFLIDFAKSEYFTSAEKIMSSDPSISKIRVHPKYLGNNLQKYDELFSYGNTGHNSYYPTSLRPAIWRKDFFLKLLNHPSGIRNPHDFENRNNLLSFEEKVLVPNELFFADLDAMRVGAPNPQTFQEGKINMDYYFMDLKSEDLDVFSEMKNSWQNELR